MVLRFTGQLMLVLHENIIHHGTQMAYGILSHHLAESTHNFMRKEFSASFFKWGNWGSESFMDGPKSFNSWVAEWNVSWMQWVPSQGSECLRHTKHPFICPWHIQRLSDLLILMCLSAVHLKGIYTFNLRGSAGKSAKGDPGNQWCKIPRVTSTCWIEVWFPLWQHH